MTVVVYGLPQLHAKLASLAASADVIADQAKDVYAEGIAASARSHAPVLTGELRDSIHVDEEGNVVADADHAWPNEVGTDNMAAQPFMRPAADEAHIHTPEAAVKAGATVEAIV